jgi:hypothetical protein
MDPGLRREGVYAAKGDECQLDYSLLRREEEEGTPH